ncbi:LPS export ABC transporter periplasmic protein LptC [Guyparkeria hydrothermalis]|uniref:LPS export ABC transporter periplasmic protein LptC n=1 Tax=Guyparkeria hydrothermalis TaxID=923 RepID=UPI0020217419|nr:LPS export ABC transporter periplasmic protein LptC [Guyparkeria hydrothermalis]MCL7744053.1 LPS export ABC transporter periplasmic protein LptC [Guyparkeria hydrothermalis]
MKWPLPPQANRALLAVLGIGLLGLLTWENLSDEFLPQLEATGGYAQRLDQVSSWQYDEEGRLSYQLATPRAIQRDAEDRYELEAPEAALIDEPDTPPWTIDAARGTLLDGGKSIRLDGSVVAARAPHQDRGRLELRTDRLWVYPERYVARTDLPSTLQELGASGERRWTSKSDAFHLDWDERILTQSDRIRDRIEPQAQRQ